MTYPSIYSFTNSITARDIKDSWKFKQESLGNNTQYLLHKSGSYKCSSNPANLITRHSRYTVRSHE